MRQAADRARLVQPLVHRDAAGARVEAASAPPRDRAAGRGPARPWPARPGPARDAARSGRCVRHAQRWLGGAYGCAAPCLACRAGLGSASRRRRRAAIRPGARHLQVAQGHAAARGHSAAPRAAARPHRRRAGRLNASTSFVGATGGGAQHVVVVFDRAHRGLARAGGGSCAAPIHRAPNGVPPPRRARRCPRPARPTRRPPRSCRVRRLALLLGGCAGCISRRICCRFLGKVVARRPAGRGSAAARPDAPPRRRSRADAAPARCGRRVARARTAQRSCCGRAGANGPGHSRSDERGAAHAVQAHHRDGAPHGQHRAAAGDLAPRTWAVFTARSNSKAKRRCPATRSRPARSCARAPSRPGARRAARCPATRATRRCCAGDRSAAPTARRPRAFGTDPAFERARQRARAVIALAFLAVGGAVGDDAQRLGNRARMVQGRRTISRPWEAGVRPRTQVGFTQGRLAAQGQVQQQPGAQHIGPRGVTLRRTRQRFDAAARVVARQRHAPALRAGGQQRPPVPSAAPCPFAEQHHVRLQVAVRHTALMGKGQALQHGGQDGTSPAPAIALPCSRSSRSSTCCVESRRPALQNARLDDACQVRMLKRAARRTPWAHSSAHGGVHGPPRHEHEVFAAALPRPERRAPARRRRAGSCRPAART